MIAKHTIDEIKATAQVEEVVSDFVTLKRRGVNFLGLCPFHNEKTPSFTVSPSKGIYKCFGCGASGSAITFLMEHEGQSYPEALRYLADKYNITIEETGEEPEDKEEQDLRESLGIINNFTQQYYADELYNTDEGRNIGLSYFKERGFSEKILKKFWLGYANADFESFVKKAKKKGYQLELLKKAGLVSSKNGRDFDFFRERVIFTIHNLSGKPVAFAGRTLRSDKKIPKYINSPETEVYNKSKVLYGMFFAKNAIRKEDVCLLVEGYTDVLSLHQAGIENVVASSGTSLTTEQVRLVKRYTKNITILYDGDAAGLKAAMRGVELIIDEGLDVKVVALPKEEDPDSFIRSIGASEFQQFVNEKATDFIMFKAEQLMKGASKDPAKKSAVINEMVETIARIKEHIKRSVYIRECSQLMEVDERVLITAINKLTRRRYQKETDVDKHSAELLDPTAEAPKADKQTEGKGAFYQAYEKELIRIMLEYGDKDYGEHTVGKEIAHEFRDFKLENEALNKILHLYIRMVHQDELPDQDFFLKHEDEEISKAAIEILHSPYEISENWDKMHEIQVSDKNSIYKKDVNAVIKHIQLQQIMDWIKDQNQRLKETEDEKEMLLIQKRLQMFHRKKQELCNELGTVVLP